MFKITKAINKFSDELDIEFGPNQELTRIFAQQLVAEARDTGSLLAEEDEAFDVTVEKAGPYAAAKFSVPVKDFDKFIAAANTN